MRDPYDVSVAFDDLEDDVLVMGHSRASLRERVAHWVERAKQKLATRLRGDDVRVDDDPSYLAFRVSRLESALRQHVADGHGSPVTVLGDAVKLPCCASGAIDCWSDGRYVVCTVRFEAPEGLRMATASTAIEPVIDGVIGAAKEADVDFDDVQAYAGPLSAMVAADRLVSDICGCVMGYLESPKTSRMSDHSFASNQYLHGCDLLVDHGRIS